MANEQKNDGPAIVTRRVKLLSYLSGKDGSLPPGSIVELDGAEAGRLIGIGAAVAVVDAVGQAGPGEAGPEEQPEEQKG